MDDMYELDIDENLNLEDYTVYVHENVDENMNVNAYDENMNADDENVNADDEYDSAKDEQDHVDDEKGRGTVREDFIVNEEHVVDEVEVNMESFNFSVQEQGADQTVTPNVDLTDEALEVLDFDSFDSDVGDDSHLDSDQYKEMLWKYATATTEVHFERAMDEFNGYNRLAHEWLRKIPPKQLEQYKIFLVLTTISLEELVDSPVDNCSRVRGTTKEAVKDQVLLVVSHKGSCQVQPPTASASQPHSRASASLHLAKGIC
ncbi:hypothetical protein Tco_0409015 [Tanacetum coccineum]